MSAGKRVEFTPGGTRRVTHGGSGNAYANYGCRCDECTEANTQRVERRRAERDAKDAAEHGTVSTYSNWNCRCDLCTTAHCAAMGRQRESRLARRANDAPHGTPSGYNSWGCRCDLCREANREYDRARYAAKKAAS